MVGGLIGEGIGGLLKSLVIDVVFEIIIQGTGYIFIKYVIFLGLKKDVEPGDWMSTLVGIIVWITIAIVLYKPILDFI